MKPAELIVITIEPVRIGWFEIRELEIDLKHINYGMDTSKENYRILARSNYTTDDVVDLFSLLSIKVDLEPRDYKNGYYYFSKVIEKAGKKFSIAFCVHEEKPTTAGIITLYRVNLLK